MNMSRFLKIFRRRSVTEMLDNFAEQIDQAAEEERTLTQRLERIRNQKPPDSAGLDIPTKRSINLMILAFAQQLYIYFADDDLAEAVRESREKSVGPRIVPLRLNGALCCLCSRCNLSCSANLISFRSQRSARLRN